MVLSNNSKGKKRALEEVTSDGSSSTLMAPQRPIYAKKSKRAETRQCPVCDEAIPIRLLGRHSELESERVEDIIRQIGSQESITDEFEEGSSTGSRRSAALKARKSLNSVTRAAVGTTEQTYKVIQSIKRHRKQRHIKLKEMMRDEEDGTLGRNNRTRALGSGEISCPICFTNVRGDNDVVEAHIDACLANESRRLQEDIERGQMQDEIDVLDVEYDGAVGHVGDVRGTGFHTRNQDEQDVDEEVDVDGDDQTFGAAQFTEGDLLGSSTQASIDENRGVEIEGEDETIEEQKTLRDLVAEGEVRRRQGSSADPTMSEKCPLQPADISRIDLEVQQARQRNDQQGLVAALEKMVGQLKSTRTALNTLTCRICLDPYSEPTVSTGCWHTCCRECWLRCLGSTKLCPICKRITSARDLRRVYL